MTNASAASDTEIQALWRISERPNLVALAYALRHPETWPEGFVWDYGDCAACAVGLAVGLWPNSTPPDWDDDDYYDNDMKSWIARTMAMPFITADDIFFGLAPIVTEKVKLGWFRSMTKEWTDWDSVYPEDVADAIDRYLATAE